MGVGCVIEQKRDIENAAGRHGSGQRSTGDHRQVDGTELDRLEHLNLAAERGVGELLDLDPAGGGAVDILGHGPSGGAKLAVGGEEIAHAQAAGLARGGRCNRRECTGDCGADGMATSEHNFRFQQAMAPSCRERIKTSSTHRAEMPLRFFMELQHTRHSKTVLLRRVAILCRRRVTDS
jgi:hypothetical protein